MFAGAIILVSLAYIGVLFAIARFGDKRADRGQSIIASPYVYALSMGVYCTAWTYYGSVGRAAATGVGFLPIYLGPTLMAVLGWFVLRKMVRISKTNRITTIADFVASRYGKSTLLGSLVTLIAVIGIVPYIALQLDAVSSSFTLLWNYPDITSARSAGSAGVLDTAFYVSLAMVLFAILFGTRHLDVTEHHEGLVAAISFESIIKLAAFTLVGVYVAFGLFNGADLLYEQAAARPDLARLFTFNPTTIEFGEWTTLTLLSMMAILFLPRQFQMSVLENMDERHVAKASWLFPLYLFAINLFVLPIALAGLLLFPDGAVDADMFVLALPMHGQQQVLALIVFIGGLSAATSMVIVDTVALSTMVSNDLLMPLLLRAGLVRSPERRDVGGLLLAIRRIAIAAIILLGYLYFRLTGGSAPLVSIGLISFAAVAQFAPAVLGGIYWKGGTRAGALAGLIAGFLTWGYTLSLPSLHVIGGAPDSFVVDGPWGIGWLRPYALFGLTDLDPITHALFWSLLVNTLLYVVVSLLRQPSAIEHSQASRFVDAFQHTGAGEPLLFWRGAAPLDDLRSLLERFLGAARTERLLSTYARQRGVDWQTLTIADADLVQYAENQLAGVIGTASARVATASVVQEDPLTMDEMLRLLDETSQVLAYSQQLEERTHQLEQKSLQLEAASAELRAANERLQELDRLKDDFISTVTHELRTPLTSIRAFSEILYDNPDLDAARRTNFLEIILKESERLTRLINQVLDLAKLESGAAEWHTTAVHIGELIDDALVATSGLFAEKNIQVTVAVGAGLPAVWVDRDRVMQVLINLLSNASKFAPADVGAVQIRAHHAGGWLQMAVIDNGPGISPDEQAVIFQKFRQAGDQRQGKPKGTGLGLPISAQIIGHFGGRLWVESEVGAGATFLFTLPLEPARSVGSDEGMG